MFYDTVAFILNENKNNIGKIQVDFQPYDKTMQFEENIQIDITARAFCNKEKCITEERYLLIDNYYYKIMYLKKWSSYWECWLYQCQGDADETN